MRKPVPSSVLKHWRSPEMTVWTYRKLFGGIFLVFCLLLSKGKRTRSLPAIFDLCVHTHIYIHTYICTYICFWSLMLRHKVCSKKLLSHESLILDSRTVWLLSQPGAARLRNCGSEKANNLQMSDLISGGTVHRWHLTAQSPYLLPLGNYSSFLKNDDNIIPFQAA